MLVLTGIFEQERFITDKLVSLPQGKRVIVSIEEEKAVPLPVAKSVFKELSLKAKTLRSRIESETGIVDVRSLICEGRNR